MVPGAHSSSAQRGNGMGRPPSGPFALTSGCLVHTRAAHCRLPQVLLEQAVAVEDGMGYMEPPRLYQPVRHCLGRLLLSAGRPAEAAQVCARLISLS